MGFKCVLMNRVILSVLIVFLVLCDSNIKATHIVGGNMTYRCIGNDNYEISLVVQRDCSEVERFDSIAVVSIYRASDGFFVKGLGESGSGLIAIPKTYADTIHETITNECSFVNGPLCVEEMIYKDSVWLPFLEGGYILAYQRCCRNINISNIRDPLETGSVFYVELSENVMELCNNSPVFNNPTSISICKDEEFEFDHAAYDIDGDSLVYSLCQPYNALSIDYPVIVSVPVAANNPPPFGHVEWQPPYSLSNIMGSGSVEIDAHTGLLTCNPSLVGQFLISICVEEFRDGISLGKIYKDFEYNVRLCSETPIVEFSKKTLSDGLTLEFTNLSDGADTYEWYFDYPNEDTLYKSSEHSPSFTYPLEGNYEVLLIATRDIDGCGVQTSAFIEVIDLNYIPFDFENGIWRFEGGTFGEEPEWDDSQIYVSGDTIINNEHYKKLYNYTIIRRNFPPLERIVYGYIGAIRNMEGKKVGFISYEDSEESIIYDFNLIVGDTLRDVNEDVAVVTSIDSMEYCGVFHKRFNLNVENSEPQFLVEGIGYSSGLVYPFFYQFEITNTLKCYTIKDSTACETCDLLLADKLISKDISFSLFPNPNNGNFTIKTEEEIVEVKIFDMMGLLVYQEYNVIGIEGFNNDIQLASGVYWLLSTTKNENKFLEKLLIIE